MASVDRVERSAGVIVHRWEDGVVQVLLGHLGGPYWARKNDGAWTVPKGLVEQGEDDEQAARREFYEETGQRVPEGEVVDLGVMRQNSGKEMHVWAVRGALDAAECASTTFELEWPPRSGQTCRFPELDRFAWFDLAVAEQRIVQGQRPVLAAVRLLLET